MALKRFLFLLYVFVVVSSSVTEATRDVPKEQSRSSAFDFIKKLHGCQRGKYTKGLHDIKKYMENFGYLKYESELHAHDDYFDRPLASAIKLYQQNYDLRPTGRLDAETISTMIRPRCGVADVVNGTNFMLHGAMNMERVAAYSFFPGRQRWPDSRTHLTYVFHGNVPARAIPPIERAFQSWAAATHFRFQRVGGNGDINIEFASRNHGDGHPFDGPGSVLAHAFAPTDGRMHHDADEPWSVGPVANAFDIQTVAAHEIGHLLGLGHSSVQDALMYPSVSSGQTKGIHPDDVMGIRALYNR